MNLLLLVTLAHGALAPANRPAPAAVDGLVYQPAPGLVVARELSRSFETTFADWTIVMNGSEVPAQYLPKLSIQASSTAHAAVRDELRAARDGRPLALRREYADLALADTRRVSVDGVEDAANGSREGKSSVANCIVVFDERMDDATQRRVLERGECDRDALDGLALDLDFTALLPGDSASDDWELDVQAFNPFEDQLAGVAFELETSPEEWRRDAEQLRENATGTWRLERLEQLEEDGLTLEVIRLKGEFESFATAKTDLERVPVADGAADERTDLRLDIDGELVWDATHGVLHKLEWDATGQMSVRTTRIRDGSGTDAAYEQTMRFECAASLRVSANVESIASK